MRSKYLLFKRSSGGNNGRTYYVKVWDFDLQRYTSVYSVGSLQRQLGTKALHLSPTSKAGANVIVTLWIEYGQPQKSGDLFSDYLKNFWYPDSDYIKIAAARGKNISDAYIANNRSGIIKHVIPYLETSKQNHVSLNQITPALLENLLMHLKDNTNLSNRRINAIYQAVTVPLSEAKRLGKIHTNPAESVKKLVEKKPERKILTPPEVKKFFAQPIGDIRLYAINMLAATTGMRLGECRGLQIEDFHESWIDIKWNWQDGEGLKIPKWGSNRAIPVPSKTSEILLHLISTNPWGNNFVFYGHSKDRPIGKRSIETYYKQILNDIKIDDEKRKERNLNFHAWRHFYNTMLRGHIPDHALRKLTGHKNEEMTDRYSEITDKQRKAVAELAEGLF